MFNVAINLYLCTRKEHPLTVHYQLVMIENYDTARRKEQFIASLQTTHKRWNNYVLALNGKFVTQILTESFGINSIFDVTDLNKLWEIYTAVNINPHNLATHRLFSSAIMSYIKFLNNGKRIGKRIDYMKPRPCMQGRKRKKPAEEQQ